MIPEDFFWFGFGLFTAIVLVWFFLELINAPLNEEEDNYKRLSSKNLPKNLMKGDHHVL